MLDFRPNSSSACLIKFYNHDFFGTTEEKEKENKGITLGREMNTEEEDK
jgi:hypothetical protein